VRYTYDKMTSVTGCNQKTHIDRFLVKYGVSNANACALSLNLGSDLDSLPTPDVIDKIVMHAYAALIGELLHIAINTVPQLMSSLTRYMSKTTPAHLATTKTVLRYLIGDKGRQLTGCGSQVSCLMYSLKF